MRMLCSVYKAMGCWMTFLIRIDEKYAHQRIFVVAIDDYVYLVPYVETEDEIFLKTVIPSRKATKQYFEGDL